MSREFGEYLSGYFHTKIENALADAESGNTRGAKLMAAFLKPLSEIAYAVSSEEACDSGESFVVQRVFDQLQLLRQAMDALEEYVDPAKRLAISVLARQIAESCEVSKVGDHWEVVEHGTHEAIWDVKKDAICEVVRSRLNVRGWLHWYSSSTRCGEDKTTHQVGIYDSKERIEAVLAENRELKRKLSSAEVFGAKSQLSSNA